MLKVPDVPDRPVGIEDYQDTTKALQPVKLPEGGTDGMCRSKAPSRCSLMDDHNDDESLTLVMVVDIGAHNIQNLHVKPRLYALFVEKVEANEHSQTPTLMWRSEAYNLTHRHQAVDALLLHQDAFGGAP